MSLERGRCACSTRADDDKCAVVWDVAADVINIADCVYFDVIVAAGACAGAVRAALVLHGKKAFLGQALAGRLRTPGGANKVRR